MQSARNCPGGRSQETSWQLCGCEKKCWGGQGYVAPIICRRPWWFPLQCLACSEGPTLDLCHGSGSAATPRHCSSAFLECRTWPRNHVFKPGPFSPSSTIWLQRSHRVKRIPSVLWRLQRSEAKAPSWATSLCLSALLGRFPLACYCSFLFGTWLMSLTVFHVSDFSHPDGKMPARSDLREECLILTHF